MDAIGTPLSYDYNLRLSQKSVDMLHQNLTFGTAIPIPYIVPLPPSTLNRTILAGNTVLAQVSSTVMRVTALLPNNIYLACYGDNANSRDLWAASSSANVGSVAACAAYCLTYYTPYFGLQNGDQCYCGYSYGSYGTSAACTTKCVSNIAQMCGGVSVNSVYAIQHEVETLTVTYLGCYSDSTTRDLPVAQPSVGTVQECAGYCYGYKYFGLQFGSQCFCGNTYGSHGTSAGCTSTCSSNSTQTCGGAYANSIYSVSA